MPGLLDNVLLQALEKRANSRAWDAGSVNEIHRAYGGHHGERNRCNPFHFNECANTVRLGERRRTMRAIDPKMHVYT